MYTARRARSFYNKLDFYEAGSKLEGWQVPKVLVRHLKPYVHGGETMLDIGCGTGFVGQELQQAGWRGRLIGVDIAEKRLKEARAKRAYSFCLQANAYALPFLDKSFPVVLASAIVGLIGPKSIFEMQRLVAQGGYLAIAAGEIKSMKWCKKRFRNCRRTLKKLSEMRCVLEKDLGSGYTSAYDDEHFTLYIFRCL